MCLALPSRVVEVDEAADTAVVTLGNVRKTISTALLESVSVGEYVLVHVGMALNTIDEHEAMETLALLEKMEALAAEEEARGEEIA